MDAISERQLDALEIITERSPSIEAIGAYQRAVRNLPQIAPPTDHLKSGDVYTRTMFLAAGDTVVGAMHAKDHVNIVIGHCIVVDGTDRKELIGLSQFASKAGVKRAIVALEDTVWITIHATAFTDIGDIERDVLMPEDQPNRFFPATEEHTQGGA